MSGEFRGGSVKIEASTVALLVSLQPGNRIPQSANHFLGLSRYPAPIPNSSEASEYWNRLPAMPVTCYIDRAYCRRHSLNSKTFLLAPKPRIWLPECKN